MTQNGDTRTIGGFRAESLLRVLEETNVSAFFDNWGPTDVLQVYDPDTGLQGILVIDNTTLGPGCGGIRIAPSVTPREVFQRARTMTMAAALVRVELGGAAAGIRASPQEGDRLRLVRAFAKCISPNVPDQYIAAPDLNTGQAEMKAFAHEVGDLQGATGKPLEMGGIPYEMGVVGLGMGIVVEEYLKGGRPPRAMPPELPGARVAVQGFDKTGGAVAKYLSAKGCSIVAISDEWGAVADPRGLELPRLIKHVGAQEEKQSLAHVKGPSHQSPQDIVKVDCDVLVLTSGNLLITEENAHAVKARCLVEGLNSPLSPAAEPFLSRQGATVLPDILALTGGVVSSSCERARNACERTFSTIESTVREAASRTIQRAQELGLPVRRVASEMAKERILEALEVND